MNNFYIKLSLLIFFLSLSAYLLADNHKIPVTGSKTVTVSTGDLFYDSGGSSGHYGRSESGEINFKCAAGNVIRVVFTSFKVEQSWKCNKDALRAYDGNNTGSTQIGTYCGYSSPSPITSSGNSITFSFSSDNKWTINSGWKATIEVLDESEAFCIPTIDRYTQGDNQYISNVKIGAIDNSSGTSGYEDYTDSYLTDVEIGTGYTLTVKNSKYSEYWGATPTYGVWVDWNRDGDFEDSGETIVSESGIGVFTTTVTPPSGATVGNCRMRIRVNHRWAATACEDTRWGEVEDYILNVISPTADIEPPVIEDLTNITVSVAPTGCGAMVKYVTPTVTDNISIGNMVSNGGAELGDLSGWTIIQNEGDGWSVTGNSHSGLNSFVTSYGLCKRSQIIDLLAKGISAEDLDKSPKITVSEWFKWNSLYQTSPDKYRFKVSLLDSSKSPIVSYDSGEKTFTDKSWVKEVKEFARYQKGVRYIYIEDLGVDGENWRGYYGTFIDDLEVFVEGSSILLEQTAGLASGVFFPVGTTTNTFTATDAAGNVSTESFTVTVTDNVFPVITNCPANISLNTAGSCGAVVNWTEPTASDNCTAVGSLVWIKSHTPDSTFPVGTTTVTYTVKDESDNSSPCNFTVTVTDDEKPLAVCQDITIQLDVSGNASIVAEDIDNGSEDNCTIASLVIDQTDFTTAGNKTVVLTVSDASGNVSTCNATVTVQDYVELPSVADCLGAKTICDKSYTEVSPESLGSGNVQNELPSGDCIPGESNGIWYAFSPINQEEALLKFSITPENDADYDWVIFDMTTISCSELRLKGMNSDVFVSGSTYGTLLGGETGANSDEILLGEVDDCNGPGASNGPAWNKDITVKPNHHYMLYVSNWSDSPDGYEISFDQGGTAIIYDDVPPKLDGIVQACFGSNELRVDFTETIPCGTLDKNDTTVTIGGASYTVVDITSSNCDSGGVGSASYVYILDRTISNLGSSSLSIKASAITDMCGNVNLAISNMSFIVVELKPIGIFFN